MFLVIVAITAFCSGSHIPSLAAAITVGTPVGTPASTPASRVTATPQPQPPVTDDTNKVIQIIRGTTSGSTRVARVPLSQKHVYDPYGLIDSALEKSLESDARYLQRAGVPALVYVRRSDATRDESQEYADSLRSTWDVESAPNADDGLVIVVTMGLASPRSGSIVFSYGKNTFPVNGLDPTSLQQIYDVDMVPNLAKGKVYNALYPAIRHMTYDATFVPGSVPALSARQGHVATIVKYLAPIGTFLAGIPILLLWFSPRFATLFGVNRRQWVVGAWYLLCCVWMGVTIVAAVYARSSLGIACTIVLMLLVGLSLLIHGLGVPTPVESKHQRPRTIKVGPRTGTISFAQGLPTARIFRRSIQRRQQR